MIRLTEFHAVHYLIFFPQCIFLYCKYSFSITVNVQSISLFCTVVERMFIVSLNGFELFHQFGVENLASTMILSHTALTDLLFQDKRYE